MDHKTTKLPTMGLNELAITNEPVEDEDVEAVFKMNQNHIPARHIKFFQPLFYPKIFAYLPPTS